MTRFDALHPARRLEEGARQRRGRDDGHGSAAVGQDVGVIGGGVGGVGGDGDAAGSHDGEVGDHPARRVLRQEDDAVAFGESVGL